MRKSGLARLKSFALLFLLPGLAGLIVSAIVSANYLDTLPRFPVLEQNRVVPRGIHGITVYQTPREDRTLNAMEYSSVGVFVVGLVLGMVYLEKWGAMQASAAEGEPELLHPTG
jgi:hypothetical protein